MRRDLRALALAMLVALGALGAACAWTPLGPRAIERCRGTLVPTEAIAGDFLLQHRLRVLATDLDFPFQTVLQKQNDELVFIGVNALGSKLFTVTQRGTETEVDALPAALLPISPLNLLRDMQRVLFLRTPSSAAAGVFVEESMIDGRERWTVRHPRCGYTLEVEAIAERTLPAT